MIPDQDSDPVKSGIVAPIEVQGLDPNPEEDFQLFQLSRFGSSKKWVCNTSSIEC